MTRPLSFSDAELRSLGEGEPLVRDEMLDAVGVRACAHDLDGLHASGRLSPAGMGHGRVRSQAGRSDLTIWAKALELEVELFVGLTAMFEAVRIELNTSAWLGLRALDIQLALYQANSPGYAQHRDGLRGSTRRRVTAIVYLNPNWTAADGGCLRVYPPSGRCDISPLGGRLVLFLSDRLEHEVLPCAVVRRAATAWYRG